MINIVTIIIIIAFYVIYWVTWYYSNSIFSYFVLVKDVFNILSRVHIIRSNILQFYYKWCYFFSFRYWICQILCKNGRVFQNYRQSTGTIAAVLYEVCMKLLLKVLFCYLKDYMPFSDIYNSTFKNEAEYRQLLIQTATALQTNKFMQVSERDTCN